MPVRPNLCRSPSLLTLMACLCASPVAAQQDDSDVLSVTSRVVSVEVLVTDRRTGARVDGLRREDFELFDNGRRQELTHFSQGADVNKPLALVLFVDTHGTTKAVVPRLRAALGRALAQLQPEDQVAVFHYRAGFDMLQGLTRDRALALDALTAAAARQETAKKERRNPGDLAKALVMATRYVREKLPQSRVAFVAISDDITAISRQEVEETTKQLLAGGATVSGLIKVSGKFANALKFVGHGIDAANLSPNRGETIAYYSFKTGGEIVNVSGDDYSEALERVIGNLVGRYSLGFVPEAGGLDGKFHELTVKVKLPPELGKSRKLTLRARQGYLARKDDAAKDAQQKRGKG
jgi:VWFA-related protein